MGGKEGKEMKEKRVGGGREGGRGRKKKQMVRPSSTFVYVWQDVACWPVLITSCNDV